MLAFSLSKSIFQAMCQPVVFGTAMSLTAANHSMTDG
jgi:hypothetical protein